MKAFEKLYPKPPDTCHYSIMAMWNERRRVWKAALNWTLKTAAELDRQNAPIDMNEVIEQELKDK